MRRCHFVVWTLRSLQSLFLLGLISSCTVNISVEEDILPILRGQNPTPDIELEANLPVINHDSQNSYDLSGTCKESVESFTLEVGSISQTVTCVNGEWSVSIDASSLSEGTHTVTTNITHPTTGDPITFEITKDTQAPTVSTIEVSSGATVTNQLTIPIVVTGSDIHQVYVTTAGDCNSGGSWQTPPVNYTLAPGDGNKTLHLKSRDEAGNPSTCQMIDGGSGHTITLDQTLPVVDGLTDDAVLANAKTWNWSCTDATACEYRYSITQGAAASPSGSFSSTTTASQPSGNGVYYINVQAQDEAGNLSVVRSVSVTLSDARPSVTLSSASSNPLNAAFSVTATFSESVTGFIDSDVTITNGAISGFAGSGDTYTFTVTPTSPGLVTVGVAQNVAQNAISNGNTAASDLTRTFDNVAPTITGLSDDATWAQSKTWNWGCDEACTYRFVVDTTSNTTPSGAYGSTTTATQNSGSGTYYLHVQAQDAAGNTSLVHVSALIDNTNPVVPSSVVDGTALSSLTQSPTITFTSGSDAHSGLNKHQVRVLRSSDDLLIQDWVDFTSGNSVTGLTLTTNTSYYVEVRAVDNVGNISTAGQSDGWIADTTSPAAPTGVTLGSVPANITSSPTVTFTSSTDVGGSGISHHEARVVRVADSAVIQDWVTITSGSSLTGLSLNYLTDYTIILKAIDQAGNSGTLHAGVSWTSMDCPLGYILVPALAGYTAADFCVAKYEMKNVGGVASSQATGTPWSNIARGADPTTTGGSWKACRDLGAGFDLISNNQWQTVARNIETVGANWSTGVVGSGVINQGHSDNSPSNALAASTTDTTPCTGTGHTCSDVVWHSQRRTHVLTNGNIIWDFSGNLWERTSTNYSDLGVSPAITAGWQELSSLSAFNQSLFSSAVSSYNSSQRIGRAVGGSAGAVTRGGGWSGDDHIGIFTVSLTSSPGGTDANAGFRCVFQP